MANTTIKPNKLFKDENFEQYIENLTAETDKEKKELRNFYDRVQELSENQPNIYTEEKMDILRSRLEFLGVLEKKEEKQEQQPQSEMAKGAAVFNKARATINSGKQLELTDDELELLRSYLERMHESLADHTVENYIAEHFPTTETTNLSDAQEQDVAAQKSEATLQTQENHEPATDLQNEVPQEEAPNSADIKRKNIEKFRKQYQILAPYLDEAYNFDLKTMESVALEIAPKWAKRVRFHNRYEFKDAYDRNYLTMLRGKEKKLESNLFRIARVCAVTEMALSGKDYSNYSNRQLFDEMMKTAKQILSSELRHNYSEIYEIQRLDDQCILDDTLIRVINKNLSTRYSDDTKLLISLMSEDKEDEKTQKQQTEQLASVSQAETTNLSTTQEQNLAAQKSEATLQTQENQQSDNSTTEKSTVVEKGNIAPTNVVPENITPTPLTQEQQVAQPAPTLKAAEEEQNEADDIQEPAEQEEKQTASTAETQAPESAAAIKEAERKVRTPQQLLDIALGVNRLQNIEDGMTTQELISLHKHIGELRPRRNVKLSKKEVNALHIRSTIDKIVLHTLGTRLIASPYQELKSIEKSGEQFLLRDIFSYYQKEDKNNELQAEMALEALNDDRHKRGLENLEYRFEYLGIPKNKRPDYHQFLFDKIYETPAYEVLESMGINNLRDFKKNIDTYLASHETNDARKTLITSQINQAINSHRDAKKQEKKRRQQEENLPMIKTVYDEIKGYALVDNITEIHNVLQRLQPAQLELVEQMEQYADEQAKNETNEELKAKLENIDGYVLARISELREELRSVQADRKSTAQESSAEATLASEQPEAVQVEEKEELKSEAEAEAKVAENEELKSEAEAESEQTSTGENEQENKPKIGRFDAEFLENWQKDRKDAEEDLRLSTLHGITSLKQSMDTLGDELDSDTRSTLNEALDNKFSENFKNQENGEKGEYYKILLEWATSPEAYKVEDFRNCIEAFYPNGTVKNGPEGAELDNLMQEISKYRQEHNMEPISFGHEVNGKNYDTPVNKSETVVEPVVQNAEQENTAGGGTIIIDPASPDIPVAEPVTEPKPESRADLYNTVSIENILELTKEEPETIKEALQGYPSRAITGMYKMIQYNIDQGHVTAGDESLAKFYDVATNHILEIIKNDTRSTDKFEPEEIRERAELLQTYAQDFVGKDIAFADSHDTDFYRFQLDIFTQSAQDENDGNTDNSLNNDGAGIIIIDNSDKNEDDNSNEQAIISNTTLNEQDEDTYWMLEQTARDAYDGYGKFYETGTMEQPHNRMVRLNRFFENVDIEHDEEWRNIGDKLRQLSSQNVYQKYDSYTAEDLKHEFLELARQNAIKEILDENEYDGQGNFLDEFGKPIYYSELREKIQEKVLDHMEESVITLMLSQALRENNDRLLAGLEKDEKGELTAQGLEDFRNRVLKEITEIGDRDTSRSLIEKAKNFVAFWQTKDGTKHKFTIYDSVAFSVVKERCSQVHEDIKNLWNKFTSKTKVGAFAAKLYERNKQFNEKLAKDHPKLNILYQYGKGLATSLAVGFIAAKTAPIVMTVYCASMSTKAVKSVYKGYKEYKKQNEESNFWDYCKNNKAQVIGTALVATGTAVGIGADALNGAHFNWANISKGSRLSGAIMMGANSALEEAKKGHYGVAFTRALTTGLTIYLGANNTNASNENVNDNDLQNMLKQQELMDKEVEQQKATFNIYRPAENLSQDTSQSTDTIEDQQSTSNDNNNQHHAPAKHTTPTVNNDDEIARVKEAVKFTAPEIERDAPGDDLASSGSAIGDFTLPEYVEQPPHPPALSNAETLFVNDQAMGDVTLKQAENGFSIHYSNEIEGRNHTEMMIEQDGVKHCVIQQEDGSMRYMTPAEEEKFMYSVNRICTECHNDIAYDKDLLNHIHNSPTVQSMEETAFYEREEFQELARAKDIIASAEETTVNEPQSPTVNNEKSDNLTANNIDSESNINNEASNTVSETLSSATSHGLTGEALYTHTSGDTSISVYENGFHGIEKDESGTVTQWGIKVEDGSAHGYIQTADGEKVMTPQQIDYYNKLSSDYLMKNDNPARDQVIELQGNISNVVNPEDNSATSVTNVVENSESKNLPFAIGNDYDPITKQPIQIITTQGENGFYGTDRDANGNELRNWSITIDENGVRHATIHDANGAVKMSDKEFTKYMLQTMELRNPQNEAQSHTSELINQILDSRIQIDGANLQYNDTSLFLSTSPDGKDGVLWTMNDNEPPHFYEITNGQKNEIDFARACELEEDIDREVQKLPAGNFRDQLYNFVADCQMKAAFENANNLDIYAQECNLALNLPPAQETIVADDLSRVTNISNDGILVIEKNGTMTYAYHDPSAQGDIRMVRIDADGVKHPINSQTTTAQEFFAENRELFEKAEIMHSDFAMAAYGMDSGSENMTTLDQPAAATLYQGENTTVKYNQDGFSITENGVTMTVVERDGHVVCEKIDANGQHTPMTSKELQDFNNQLKQYTQGDIETKRLLMWNQATSQHTEAISEQLNNNAFRTPYATSDNQSYDNNVDLSHLHIMAATERATEFGLTGGDTRSVETGQYKGTVVTKAENGWQIRYPEGNSIILKAENGTLSGMFIDADDKVTNMKPQEVEQYRQAAAEAYKNSQTTYGKTSSNTGTHSGRMVGRGNGYI